LDGAGRRADPAGKVVVYTLVEAAAEQPVIVDLDI
jgi:hypothetical protein